MTWRYDSLLAAPIRTVVRNAIVTKLAPLKAPTGFLEAVIPIGYGIKGPDDPAIDLLWDELGNQQPAIAVALLDIVDEPAGAPGRTRGTVDIELYFLSTHRRGLTEGRTTGDAAAAAADSNDPGLDAMLELAWQFLQNVDLGVGQHVQPLKRKSEHEIISDNTRTIWRQHWSTMVTLDVNANRDLVQMLTQLHTTLLPVGDEPIAKHMVEDTNVP